MKPALAVIIASALVLGPGARPVSARSDEGLVRSLSVLPAAGKAEIVIGVKGGGELRDFTLRSPDRIVLDLNEASLGLVSRGYDRVSRGGIVDVRYSQFKRGTVRVVVSLDGPHSYQVSRTDGEVRLAVSVPAETQFAAWHVGTWAGATGARTVAQRSAGEARAADEGAVVLQRPAGEPLLGPASVPASGPASGPTSSAARPADRTAPARTAKAESEPEPLNMRTTMSRPVNPSQVQQPRSQQPAISVIFDGSDVRDVIATFASYSGRTIIPGSQVPASKVNAEIKNQPWDVALQAILSAQGLAAVEDANGILIVDTQERIAARSETEALSTTIVQLNYQRATPVASQIRQRLLQCIPSERSGGGGGGAQAAPAGQPPTAAAPPAQPTVSPTNARANTSAPTSGASDDGVCRGRGTVTQDETTNTISITAPVSVLDGLVSFAHTLDQRQPAVNIKAKIVLVNRTDLDALGIKYDLGSAQQFFSNVIQRLDTAGKVGTPNDPPRVLLGGNTVSAIANASGDVPGAALRLVYSTAIGNFDFSTFLDALQSVNLLDVQSEPSVTTINNKTATLISGAQVPFVPLVSSGGSGTSLTGPVTVERVQTGVTLDVTPSVTNNRQILMHVEVTNSDVNFTNNGTLIDNNHVQNDLLVGDGQTVVIGGLTQTSVRVTKSGIPLLVDLPLIGRLFGYTTRQEQRRDLLIMITPHIVDEGQRTYETVRP